MSTGTDAGNCPFCAIAAGRLPSSQVYADDRVIAFLDIRPLTTGHLLVVPRAHAADLDALAEADGAHMFTIAQRLARALPGSGVRCEGVNLFLANGAVAGQEVFHVHLHVLPRSASDGFSISAQGRRPDRAELDATAAMVRDGIARLR